MKNQSVYLILILLFNFGKSGGSSWVRNLGRFVLLLQSVDLCGKGWNLLFIQSKVDGRQFCGQGAQSKSRNAL